MNILVLIVLGLATWRVSAIVVKEDGPFHIFEKLRDAAGIMEFNGSDRLIPERFFAELLSCVWCFSMWVGTFFVVLWILIPQIAFWIALPFCLSALAIISERLTS